MTKLSDTQTEILTEASRHLALLASATRLPTAARQSVFRSMLKNLLLAEVPAPTEHGNPAWRQGDDGAPTPGADDLMMRIYAAMAQKERELISARTKAALAAAKARGVVLGGDRGYRPKRGPDAAAAARARRVEAERTAHRLVLAVEALHAIGMASHAGVACELTRRFSAVSAPGQSTGLPRKPQKTSH